MDEEIKRQLALLESLDWEVRRTAIEALIEIGAPAIPALIEALLDRKSFYRYSAAEALGRIGNTSAIPALVEVLNDGNNRDLDRESSAEALGSIGDASVIPVLIQALRDRESDIRLSATRALYVIALFQPTVQLRGAIPVLKRLVLRHYLSGDSIAGDRPGHLEAFKATINAIEKATQELEALPIAASAPVTPVEDLPIAADEAPPS